MKSHDPEADNLLENHYFCRSCGAYLPLDVICLRCRPPADDTIEIDEVPRTTDIVMSVILELVALIMTMPITFLAVKEAALFGSTRVTIFSFTLLSLWNGYFVGYPVIVLTRRWHQRIQHNQFGYSWIWGDYWRLQLQVLAPLLIIAILPALLIVAYWLRFLFLP